MTVINTFMIDLRNLGGGKKLIKDVVKNSKQNNQLWTKQNQINKSKTLKNPHTPQSRIDKK